MYSTVVSENRQGKKSQNSKLIHKPIIYEYHIPFKQWFYLKSAHDSHFLNKYVFIPHFAYLVKRHHNSIFLWKKLKMTSHE